MWLINTIFITPYHVKEDHKQIADKEIKWQCHLGILKEGFSAYSSPVMLISKELTIVKRYTSDFRHISTRINVPIEFSFIKGCIYNVKKLQI